jgi:Xaa-Pro aminopeptidase
MRLPISFHRERRQQLLSRLKPESVCIVPGSGLVTRSRDTEYTFRQDSDFWYLTGFNEPNAWLILSNSELYDGEFSLLVCQPKDSQAEIWHGRRVGPEHASDQFDMDDACSNEDIEWALSNILNRHSNLYFALGHNDNAEELVFEVLKELRAAPKQTKQAPNNLIDVRPILHEMRLIKTPEELKLMSHAAEISAKAHCRAMRSVAAAEYEYQLEAEILHEFAYAGARDAAYSSIVGSGENACILHYTENNAPLEDGDLVLIDAGAEYQGYAADITRTFPVNGRFSDTQREIYQLVLDSQLAALEMIKPGATIGEAMNSCLEVLVGGLINLGILSGDISELIESKAYQPYFMHGLGHYLGLDVHDVGDYKYRGEDRKLEPGMVLTVEPGLYFAPDADVPKEYKGIGIRIEDDVLITYNGNQVLTCDVPKTISEIELLMSEK